MSRQIEAKSAMEVAAGIVDSYRNYQASDFEWLKKAIAVAILDTHDAAKIAEHDRIEQFIGTRNFQEVREMIAVAKNKWGKRPNANAERQTVVKIKERIRPDVRREEASESEGGRTEPPDLQSV